jgi:ATP-binding cassette subfamily B protein
VTADLRRAVFDHLLTLPPKFYEAMRTGDVISRLINDTAMLETVIGSSASMAIRNLLLLAGGLTMLAITSAKLTLLVLAGVPVVVVPIVLFGRRVRKLARASQDRSAMGARRLRARTIRTVRRRARAGRPATVKSARRGAFGGAGTDQAARDAGASVIMPSFSHRHHHGLATRACEAGRLSAGQLSAFVFYARSSPGGWHDQRSRRIRSERRATERLSSC